jgi:hypothetical protein
MISAGKAAGENDIGSLPLFEQVCKGCLRPAAEFTRLPNGHLPSIKAALVPNLIYLFSMACRGVYFNCAILCA